MTEPTPEAYEAAARAVARDARKHGQLCPCARAPLADIGLCDCWVLINARHDVRSAVGSVWSMARVAAEAQVRAKAAPEIRALGLGWCTDGAGRHLIENCVRIAEGKGDET